MFAVSATYKWLKLYQICYLRKFFGGLPFFVLILFWACFHVLLGGRKHYDISKKVFFRCCFDKNYNCQNIFWGKISLFWHKIHNFATSFGFPYIGKHNKGCKIEKKHHWCFVQGILKPEKFQLLVKNNSEVSATSMLKMYLGVCTWEYSYILRAHFLDMFYILT